MVEYLHKMKKWDDKDIVANLPWEEIFAIAKEKSSKKEYLTKKRLKFILDEKNYSIVLDSVFKSLEKTDPRNATQEYAEKLLYIMQEFAQKMLKKLSKKPFDK